MRAFGLKIWAKLFREPEPVEAVFSLWVRLLGVLYFFAFVSVGVQALGLFGEKGILPVAADLGLIRERFGLSGFWMRPTLSWFWTQDSALILQCAAAVAASLLLILGRAVTPLLWVCWLLHLSIIQAGGIFFYFQWDTLLSEMGFLACFLGSWDLGFFKNTGSRPPAFPMVLALRWLMFRLMFGSGWVKVFGGDTHWTGLSALRYHFETQPLPSWPAWYAHQMPDFWLKSMTAATLGIELVVPFLIFCGRGARKVAAVCFAVLMLLILATGNYGYFNLATLLLCLSLLDDRDLPCFLRSLLSRIGPWRKEGRETRPSRPIVSWVVFAVLGGLSAQLLWAQVTGLKIGPPWMNGPHRTASTFRLTSLYGLFARMTLRRPEIILEGSMDGKEWKAYEFKFKPGDLFRAPVFNGPHQPRLDWQLWFAALSGSWRESPWTLRLAEQLLKGSDPVEGLLKQNPFPSEPPRWIRAELYDYRFSSQDERRQTGAWWTRRRIQPFFPPVSLKETQD